VVCCRNDNKEDHRRLGVLLLRKICNQQESPGDEQRELSVTTAGGRNSSPNVPERTRGTNS